MCLVWMCVNQWELFCLFYLKQIHICTNVCKHNKNYLSENEMTAHYQKSKSPETVNWSLFWSSSNSPLAGKLVTINTLKTNNFSPSRSGAEIFSSHDEWLHSQRVSFVRLLSLLQISSGTHIRSTAKDVGKTVGFFYHFLLSSDFTRVRSLKKWSITLISGLELHNPLFRRLYDLVGDAFSSLQPLSYRRSVVSLSLLCRYLFLSSTSSGFTS